ncbi:MAG: CDP-alcohol phosphatidyltransferase [Actinobacteria bacterium 13_2_20CM_2_72_6]|nr:MAG: CDP-alcohol phosphatidyltransferase [Actinobacteria bacterium 13_2_20CM_2_72_6]
MAAARSRRADLVPLSWDQYATRWSGLHGGVDPRDGSPPVRGWLRLAYGVGRLLARLGVRPATVTAAGLLLCVLVPVAVRAGRLGPVLGAGLVVLSTVADSADGAVAVITNRVTRLGYVYDSVADRLGEVAWLVALWLLGVPVWLVITTGGLAWLHEYLRARATAAGMKEIGAVTVAERPTRAIVVTLGLFLAGLGGLVSRDLMVGTATMATATWLLLGAVGLTQLTAAMHAAFARRPRDDASGP